MVKNKETFDDEYFDNICIDDVYGGFSKPYYSKGEDIFSDNEMNDFYAHRNEAFDEFDFNIPFIFKACMILTSAFCMASVGYTSYKILQYIRNI